MGYERRKGPIDYKGYGRKKKKNNLSVLRVVGAVALFFCVGWILVQLFGSGEDTSTEAEKTKLTEGLFLDRKSIYDRNFQALAVSFCQYAAYVKPLEVEGKAETARALAQILGLDEKGLLVRLNTERTYIWLGQKLQSEQAKRLLEMNLAGVYLQEKPVRYYPHGTTMAQILGYVKDGKGLAGVELYYDGALTGGVGHADASHVSRPVFETGKHVVLTIDLKIQTTLEKVMVQLLEKTEATSVSAMAVDTATGAILASVQLPSFDPNTFWDGHPRNQQLQMVTSLLDTGGISALFRYAAAVDAGSATGSLPLAGLTDGEYGDAHVVLKPTLMKSGGRARAGYWWPWAGGGYISDELTELPDPTITPTALLRFQQKLGISCADDFDFPDSGTPRGKCQEGQLNGISLLGGFTRLVNGGKPVYVHTMSGTVTDEGQFMAYEFAARGEDIGGVSSMLGQSFAASAGDGANLFAVEYLSPKAQDDAVTVESEDQEGKTEIAVLKKDYRHDGILLGAMPAQSPKMTILVVVEEGRFDLGSASPLRNSTNRFVRQISLTDLEQETGDEDELPDPELLRDKFAGIQQTPKVQTKPTPRKDISLMPDVRGLSLRKALVLIQPHMVSVEITGAGYVVEQIPEAGADVGSHVTLVLGEKK